MLMEQYASKALEQKYHSVNTQTYVRIQKQEQK